MNKTGIGPQQLLTYTQTQVQNCVESQITCVRNLLHGKLRSDLRSCGKEGEGSPRRKTKAVKSITVIRGLAAAAAAAAAATRWNDYHRSSPDTQQANRDVR